MSSLVCEFAPKGLFLRFEASGGLLTRVNFVDDLLSPEGDDFALVAAAAWLEAYSQGNPAPLPPLDWSRVTEFRRKVYLALCQTRPGQTISYGGLALRAGYPGAARAVGSAMRANPWPVIVPCHRVLPADGTLGAYSPGPEYKRQLLAFEGVLL